MSSANQSSCLGLWAKTLVMEFNLQGLILMFFFVIIIIIFIRSCSLLLPWTLNFTFKPGWQICQFQFSPIQKNLATEKKTNAMCVPSKKDILISSVATSSLWEACQIKVVSALQESGATARLCLLCQDWNVFPL